MVAGPPGSSARTTRSELIRQVAGGTGLGLAAADAAVGAVLAGVSGALASSDTVRLAGFGTFAAKDRYLQFQMTRRKGLNPHFPSDRFA